MAASRPGSPATDASVPVTTSQSSNWSGYPAMSGPYTVVKGSFTVPSLSARAFGDQQTAEWAGVGTALLSYSAASA